MRLLAGVAYSPVQYQVSLDQIDKTANPNWKAHVDFVKNMHKAQTTKTNQLRVGVLANEGEVKTMRQVRAESDQQQVVLSRLVNDPFVDLLSLEPEDHDELETFLSSKSF